MPSLAGARPKAPMANANNPDFTGYMGVIFDYIEITENKMETTLL